MKIGSNLTVQDYIKQARISGAHKPRSRFSATTEGTDRKAFGHTLKAARTAMTERDGRTIQDYLKNPVRTQQLTRNIRPVDFLGEHSTVSDAKNPKATSNASSMAIRGPQAKRGPKSTSQRITAGVAQAAARYNVPSRLIHAVIQAESNYKVRAVSKAGAKGLMQLMPATAKELGVRNPFNIEQNIDGGVKYLRDMLTRFNGDLKMALSAYNAGPGNVEKYNGKVPFAETRNYVAKVLHYAGQNQDSPVTPHDFKI